MIETTKLFEIRDSGTFIPVMATVLASETPEEIYLLGSVGYSSQDKMVMVTRLNDYLSSNDSSEWSNRTMAVAHRFIEESFNSLDSGAVIDVQYILGETLQPKISQRLEVPR